MRMENPMGVNANGVSSVPRDGGGICPRWTRSITPLDCRGRVSKSNPSGKCFHARTEKFRAPRIVMRQTVKSKHSSWFFRFWIRRSKKKKTKGNVLFKIFRYMKLREERKKLKPSMW
jgi:hypothetical protein